MNADKLRMYVNNINQMKSKHAKRALTRLENAGKLDVETRKIVLDAFNDFFRELCLKLFNFRVE